jgi:hypothetical protein
MTEFELSEMVGKAVNEQLAVYQKKQADEKSAAADAEQPHELALENVSRYSGQLPETPYTRDAFRDILKETISNIEAWDYGKRLNKDILFRFFSRLDREAKTPTTKEQYQAKLDAEEAESAITY